MRERPYFETLEPRILYSADFAAALGSSGAPQEEQRLLDAAGELALGFEANAGQTDAQVDFLARGAGYQVYLAGGDATVVLAQGDDGHVMKLDLIGADASAVATGEEALAARSHYLLGQTSLTDIPHFARVQYAGVYDGIDLVYYGNHGQLEYDFVVGAGADAGQIRLAFEGADEMTIDPQGDLVLRLGEQEIRFLAPVSYQDGPGGREAVESRYQRYADGSIGFALGAYDPSRALVIDPVLSYFTYLTGSLDEEVANGIAVDGAGNVYLTGQARSADFPVTAGTYKTGLSADGDAYVAKLDASLGSLAYVTYLGGSGTARSMGNAIAVDSAGQAWVAGWTRSASFPTVNSPMQSTLDGDRDGFVAKLDSSGSALLYSSYIGSDGDRDEANAIAIDNADHAYVVGTVEGNVLPLPLGALDSILDHDDAFLVKFAPDGAVVYATLLGGKDDDSAHAVAVDGAGNAYVAGRTSTDTSLQFTGALVPGFDRTNDGGDEGANSDAFVAKLNAAGTAYEYFTFLGGSGNETARAIAVDASGQAYVAGQTRSSAFPLTANALDGTRAEADGFVTVLNASGTGLVYSSFLGGNGVDIITAIDVDAAGRIYVAGYTDGTDGWVTAMEAGAGGNDIFVAQIDPTASGAGALLYVDVHGGSGNDLAHAAVFDAGRLYVAGETTSTGLATAGAYQPAYPAGDPLAAFAAIYGFGEAPQLAGASSVLYEENALPVAVNPLLTVSDTDSTTLWLGAVSITNYVSGEDVLSFVNDGATMGNIVGHFDSVTGVLGLASAGATATVEEWQAALRAVRYANTSDNPGTSARQVMFRVFDGNTASNALSSTVTLSPVNDLPSATDATVTIDEETALVLGLAHFGAYSDLDSTALAAVEITALPAVGTLQYDGIAVTANQVVSAADIAAGRLSYIPAADANGVVAIGFRVGDGSDFSTATYTLAVNVTPVDDAPVSTDDTLVIDEDRKTALTLSDFGAYSDVEGSALAAIQITSLPASGILAIDNNGIGNRVTLGQVISASDLLAGRLIYTPQDDESGSPYAVIGFKVSDGALFSAASYDLTISVREVNDAPASTDHTVVTAEDTPLVLGLGDFGTYSDPEGTALGAVRIGALPTAGTLLFDNAAVAANQVISAADIAAGRLRFVPGADANGSGYAALGFQVSDGDLFSATTYRLTVDVTAVNDAPASTDATATTAEDTALVLGLAHFGAYSDADGDAFGAVQITALPASGELQYDGVAVTVDQVVSAADIAAGRLRFVPATDANGVAAVGFNVGDGSAFSAVACTLAIDVTPVNDTPVGVADALNAAEDGDITYTAAQLVGNDVDVDGPALAIAAVSNGANGSVVLNSDGSVTFTPNANFNGTADFAYRVTDGAATGAATTVTVQVAAVNDAPVSTDDGAATAAERILVLTLGDFGTYGDIDGDALVAVQITALPGAGSLQYQGAGAWQAVMPNQVVSAADIAAGRLRFVPSPNGTDAAIGFRVSDGGLFSSAYTLAVDVAAPVALPPSLPPAPPTEPSEAPAPSASAGGTQSGSQATPLAVPDADAANGHQGSIDAALEASLPQERETLARSSDPMVRAEPHSSARLESRSFNVAALPAEALEALDAALAAGTKGAASSFALLQDALSASSKGLFVESLDDLRQAVDDDAELGHIVSAAGAMAGLGFSVGYVAWLVRGGILLSSLLSSLPAWRVLDPLPILARLGDDEEEEEGVAA